MIFHMRNLMVASIFTILKYCTDFGTLQESKGAQNGVNLPISTQIVIKTYKFGYHNQREKFDGGIHFHHPQILYPFWDTPGVKRGTKKR